jgi:predicted enzyme related to lactoylglutathione lyase
MQVEKVKYIVWAADMPRAIRFYPDTFGGEVLRENEVIADIRIAGTILGVHSGGEGKRTWTGIAFQVADLFAAAAEVKKAGGVVLREPEDTPEEEAHLAMCVDPEGNEFMLTKARRH